MAATVVGCVLVGLAVGAYLPGVVARVPAGEPVLVGGLGPRERWSARRGVTIALVTAAIFGLLAARFGPAAELPAYLSLGAAGVALAVIDLDCHRLPNSLTVPSYAIGISLLGVAALSRRDGGALLRAIAAMAVLFAVFYLLALLHPRGMGFGDVKLAGVLGLYLGWLGWAHVLLGAFLAFLLSAVSGLALIATGRATLKSALPFGPFLLAGALIAVLWGDPLADWYAGG
jgi:leader peptidase (prepilin peptidase)/N-methyltransferase